LLLEESEDRVEDHFGFGVISSERKRAEEERENLVERNGGLVLEHHASDGTTGIVLGVLVFRLTVFGEAEKRVKSLEDSEVLRGEIGRRVEDEGTHGESSVRLNFRFGVGEGLEEEGEERLGELSRSRLHSVDDFGEGTDSGRSVSR